jgi:hypothetical protein
MNYEETMRRQKAQEEAMQTMQNTQEKADTVSTDLLKVLNHLATTLTIGPPPTSQSPQSSPAELRTGTPGISSLGPISKQRDG